MCSEINNFENILILMTVLGPLVLHSAALLFQVTRQKVTIGITSNKILRLSSLISNHSSQLPASSASTPRVAPGSPVVIPASTASTAPVK